MDLLSHFIVFMIFLNLSQANSNPQTEVYQLNTLFGTNRQHPFACFQSLDVKNFLSYRNLSFSNAVHFSGSSNYLHKKTTRVHSLTRSACLSKLLVLLAGDVELNPGPRKPKYPCIVCGKACTWNTPAVCCDDCDGWYHTDCMGMHPAVYSALGKPDTSWHCTSCGIPQFTSSLFNSFYSSEAHSSFCSDSSLSEPIPFPSPNSFSTAQPIASSPVRIPPTNKISKFKILTLLAINFQSVMSKKDELGVLIECQMPDIIVGTEIFIKNKIKDSEFMPSHFEVHRNDRSDGYGGVFIAISKDISSKRITPEYAHLEYVACQINLINQPPLIINAAYRPPYNRSDYFHSLCREIEKTISEHPNSVCWTVGDLNLPDIDWVNLDVVGGRYLKEINECAISLVNNTFQEQQVKDPTRLNNILDIFLSNRPSLTSKCSLLPGLSDHDVISVKATLSAKFIKKPKRNFWDWKNRDDQLLHRQAGYFCAAFLSNHTLNDPVENLWNCFKKNLFTLIEDHVPSKTTNNSKKQPWISDRAKQLCRKKKRWFKKMKECNSDRVKKKYLDIKRECQAECRKSKSLFLIKISEDQTSNNKLFWKYVKSKKQDNISCSFLRDTQGNLQSSPSIKAQILNDQFSSVFSPPIEKDISMIDEPSPPADPITIETEGVLKLMKDINPNKSTGPDGIPPFILKELATELAPILSLLFQASLNQSTIPQDWKLAHVTPIFKKGDPLKASNYRPVSLTSIPCKILEHIVFSHTMKHLTHHNILCDNQHGFLKFRSCESQLVITLNDLLKNLDNCEQTDVILLDFAKAFDKVNHSSLVKKLDHYGIRNSLLSWITCFLSDRTQHVIMDGSLSSPASVQSGVPQGTVLGPLLFLIYINDLPQYVSPGTETRLFADDSALYRKISTSEDHQILQRDLEGLQKWEDMWSMQFHPDKCQLLRISKKKSPSEFTYSIHNTDISITSNAKYLGVTINNKLSWNRHISIICGKANSTLNFLHRNFKSCSPKVKDKLYCTYVRPALEYCSSVWDPHTDLNINKLEGVQRRAARFVNNNFSRETRVTPMLQALNWVPLSERRAKAKTTLLFKAINNLVHIPTDHLSLVQSYTRQHSNFFIPYCRTDLYRHSFYMSSIRLWNALPELSRNSPSLAAFKSSLTALTLRSSYY